MDCGSCEADWTLPGAVWGVRRPWLMRLASSAGGDMCGGILGIVKFSAGKGVSVCETGPWMKQAGNRRGQSSA